MLLLTVLASILAGGDGDEHLLVRIKEPVSTIEDVSINARLLIFAEILPADSFDDAWLEYRREQFGEWERQDIPASQRVTVSELRTVVAPFLEPRSLPGVQPGDTLQIKIVAKGRNGAHGQSSTLQIRVHEIGERETRLLNELDRGADALRNLKEKSEGEHRKLSRIERNLRDGAVLDGATAERLVSLESGWTSRIEQFGRLSRDLLDALNEGTTDRLIDPRREDRWRRTIVDVLRNCGAEGSPLSDMREALAQANQAKTGDARRVALQSTLDASDRFLDLLQGILGELQIWRDGLDVRRTVRSMLQGQKVVTEKLETEVERLRRR